MHIYVCVYIYTDLSQAWDMKQNMYHSVNIYIYIYVYIYIYMYVCMCVYIYI